jgi:hypothetical protein
MPTYVFLNKKTKKIEEHFMSISSLDEFKENNPNLETYYDSPPVIGYSGAGDFQGKKTDNTWKEVLSKIGEQNPSSPLAEKYYNKSVKQVKTDQVIKKHLNKKR